MKKTLLTTVAMALAAFDVGKSLFEPQVAFAGADAGKLTFADAFASRIDDGSGLRDESKIAMLTSGKCADLDHADYSVAQTVADTEHLPGTWKQTRHMPGTWSGDAVNRVTGEHAAGETHRC